MKSIVALLILICFLSIAKAQNYQTGDLLFQNLDCGDLCNAIESVTTGYNKQSFSHIGLVYKRNDSIYIIEAIGKDVHLTPIASFASRSEHPLLHSRLKSEYHYLIPKAIEFSLLQQGVAYDDEFLYNNGKYYCSELIYDAFAFANNGKAFFELEPMTFKQPGSADYFPVWISYYKQLGIDIPEGKPGINPAGISRSKQIQILNQ